ncbi:mite allergen Der f 3-like [Lucilia sericata]|uniref:mite allergen Der f 3-like n=1 Tax=Lucilia sericata TaxID=13632 RepID=UPI0018A85326|nr:mite allergen Der f 3-like [Lucilia sericata]
MFLCGVIFTIIAALIQFSQTIPDGLLASEDRFGFMVAIYDHSKYICGGTIVSLYFVVTAAHCFKQGRVTTGIQVIFNTIDLNNIEGDNVRRVEDIITHPRYSMMTMDFDIALVKVDDDLLKNEYPHVMKLELAQNYDVYYGNDAIVVGWGQQVEPNDVPPVRLTYKAIKIWQRDECNSRRIWGPEAYYLNQPLVSERMLCVDVPNVGPGTCVSDDGSALITNETEFLGISSWRYDCQSPGKPSVYTSIPLMKAWILKTMTNYHE